MEKGHLKRVAFLVEEKNLSQFAQKKYNGRKGSVFFCVFVRVFRAFCEQKIQRPSNIN
jgi:hypothetical protein